MTVGIIGSGLIGGTVARLSVAAGHHVVLSNSRGPETLTGLVAELGPLATAATSQQAATAGDIVVVSVPVKAYPDLPAQALASKVVLDTGNYYPQRDGQITDLDNGSLTCSGLLQRQLPDAKVVKVFNNIFFKHLASLARPSGAPDRTALPIALRVVVAGVQDDLGGQRLRRQVRVRLDRDRDHHDVARRGGLLGGGGGGQRPQLGDEVLQRLRPAGVAQHDVVAGRHAEPGHRSADHAAADDAHCHCHVPANPGSRLIIPARSQARPGADATSGS